ncbi:MAG: SHOCT domain-containing protein [Nonomuraea sp.]|nr:SHOCT domain-containing protein [Nonomuraea sp.]
MNTVEFAHWGGGFWPVIPLFWGLFWVAVVGFFLWARRRGTWGPQRRTAQAPGAPSSPTSSAEQILAERYARGVMSDDEYLQRISVLKS